MRQNIVIFTGSGISAESGLSTFRDKGGIWSKYDPDIVATPQGFEQDTETAIRFYNELRLAISSAHPNHAHTAIANLETKHDVTVITQNIDDLHERAGSTNVIHMHGDLRKYTSSANRLRQDYVVDIPFDRPIRVGDLAFDGSQLRPHVVMFGEYLSNTSETINIVKNADIFIVIGTSLKVFPANQLVNYAHKEIPRFIIDPNDVPVPDGYIHVKCSATKGIDIVINRIDELLN